MADQIYTRQQILKQVGLWRDGGLKLVFTNGCFDLLHLGHIDYLTRAAELGDRLIVGLNSDRSVKLLDKGSLRPIQDENSRIAVMGALRMIDAVVLFDDETPEALIRSIAPDVLVKGGDWKEDDIAGADFVKAHGGTVKLLPFLKGYSTTAIEEKIHRGSR